MELSCNCKSEMPIILYLSYVHEPVLAKIGVISFIELHCCLKICLFHSYNRNITYITGLFWGL